MEEAMAFQSVPECAVAAIQTVCNGAPIYNILNFRATSGSYNQTAIENLALAVASWYLGEMLPLLNPALTALQVVVRGLENENDFQATQTMGSAAGGGSGNPVPNNVAYVIKFLSGLTGRSARGRMYVGGFGVGALDTNERFITSTYRTALIDAIEELPNAVGAVNWQHVVVSRQSGGVKRPTGVWFPVTTYTTTDLRLDTMRRRIGGA
jgi:hypothetical protein